MMLTRPVTARSVRTVTYYYYELLLQAYTNQYLYIYCCIYGYSDAADGAIRRVGGAWCEASEHDDTADAARIGACVALPSCGCPRPAALHLPACLLERRRRRLHPCDVELDPQALEQLRVAMRP